MMTMSQTYAPGSRVWKNNRCSMNIITWKTINMRHVQEHASQLSLFLGQKVGSAPDWVTQAESRAA
jgi:hypothetical protein